MYQKSASAATRKREKTPNLSETQIEKPGQQKQTTSEFQKRSLSK